MGLIEKRALVANLVPPLDALLTTQLVDEFVSMERRFIQRDWEPAELDGGQFCEVLARILYHQDSDILSIDKKFDDCLSFVEADKNPHRLLRRDALHIAKVLRTVYKFRSQRGAVHVSPTYRPNHMDSKFLMESVRWAMNETLRIFWNGDREAVAKAVREILQFDGPCVGVFEDVIMVQRTDLTVDEEIVVLLHFAGEQGFTRSELYRYCMHDRRRIGEALARLVDKTCRWATRTGNDRYVLTDLGQRHLRMHLADKLLLH